MQIRLPLFFFSWLLLLLCVSLIGGSEASLPSRDLLGISPQDETYYKGLSSGAAIKCKNGSNKFTPAQLNDDFCDCPDGSDEPGTSACPNGKFYCQNAGHMPLIIYSSRVNDGICDCCDGSDEYGGKTKCPNMCWEAGKVARDKLKKKIAIFQEGVIIRKQEVEQAKLAILKEEAELAKLTKEEKILKDIVEQLKEHNEQIEEAEEKERMQREMEKEKKEAEEAKLEVTKTGENYLEEAENAKDGILNKIPSEDAPSLEVEGATENTESLSREELGRVVGSRWTGKKAEQETGEAKANKDGHGDHDEEYNMYDSEADTEDQMDEEDHDSSSSPLLSDDDTDDHGDDFEGEDHDSSSSSDDELDLSEAARVRKEYNGSSAKWSKIQSRISKLTRKLKHDFGPEKEFYSFHGQCFEIKQNKYTYKICPFKKATQVEEYSTTHLGNWDKFEDSYRTMQFSNGDNCWNGPDRSLKVKLRCGLKNEVNSVDEPSRCEYLAVLSTPALCSEEKLKELQDKLKMLDRELPQGIQSHDEL